MVTELACIFPSFWKRVAKLLQHHSQPGISALLSKAVPPLSLVDPLILWSWPAHGISFNVRWMP